MFLFCLWVFPRVLYEYVQYESRQITPYRKREPSACRVPLGAWLAWARNVLPDRCNVRLFKVAVGLIKFGSFPIDVYCYC